jgi:hypothetical protein
MNGKITGLSFSSGRGEYVHFGGIRVGRAGPSCHL